MKKEVKICVMVTLCLGLTSITQAVSVVSTPIKVSNEPFVGISVKPDEINLGIISPTSSEKIPGKLEAHIIANCPHNVKASITPFRGKRRGVLISSNHTNVVINGVKIPVSDAGVSIISSTEATPKSGISVPIKIDFSIKDLLMYPAGSYTGNLVLTITPGA